jgi:hypothetical protein
MEELEELRDLVGHSCVVLSLYLSSLQVTGLPQ